MAKVFVFGSNLAGRHGKGSALEALRKYGAIYGQGIGRQGSSYAIATKDENLQTIPLPRIRDQVTAFLNYAASRPEDTFRLVAIGCGLAGYHPRQVAPMFSSRPPNVILPPEFEPYL